MFASLFEMTSEASPQLSKGRLKGQHASRAELNNNELIEHKQ